MPTPEEELLDHALEATKQFDAVMEKAGCVSVRKADHEALLNAKESLDWLRDNALTVWKNPHSQGGWAIEYADGHKMARGATLGLAIQEARKG